MNVEPGKGPGDGKSQLLGPAGLLAQALLVVLVRLGIVFGNRCGVVLVVDLGLGAGRHSGGGQLGGQKISGLQVGAPMADQAAQGGPSVGHNPFCAAGPLSLEDQPATGRGGLGVGGGRGFRWRRRRCLVGRTHIGRIDEIIALLQKGLPFVVEGHLVGKDGLGIHGDNPVGIHRGAVSDIGVGVVGELPHQNRHRTAGEFGRLVHMGIDIRLDVLFAVGRYGDITGRQNHGIATDDRLDIVLADGHRESAGEIDALGIGLLLVGGVGEFVGLLTHIGERTPPAGPFVGSTGVLVDLDVLFAGRQGCLGLA